MQSLKAKPCARKRKEDKPEEQARLAAEKAVRKPKVVETEEELEDDALLGEVHTGQDERSREDVDRNCNRSR